MSKMFSRFATAGAVLGFCFVLSATSAKADSSYSVDMDFSSGGSFQGTISLSSNYQVIDSVSGTLYGYSPDTYGYVGGAATDPISWIYNVGTNDATGANAGGNYLMDTGSCNNGYCNWVDFTYDYTNAPDITFDLSAELGDPGYPPDGTDYTTSAETFVSGSITPLNSPVPEPSPLSLLSLAAAALGIGSFARRRAVSSSAVR
ncbi:MAG: PEP-CTERM sorting domain-containing protein [Terracidiphilus sp.]